MMLKNPTLWLYISILTIAASIAMIGFIGPIWGIDFVGGSLIEIDAPASALSDVENIIERTYDIPITVQPTHDDTLLIRTLGIDDAKQKDIVRTLRSAGITSQDSLRFESIGPTIGQELRRKSIIALLATIGGMIVYLAYEFRGLKNLVSPWKFGVSAVFALVHDLIFVTAMFVIFGRLWGASIDTLFVSAQLAIMGYSVNDTIVLFNRIKSEWIKDRGLTLTEVTNKSMRAILGRSFNTAFAAALVQLALLIFGGSTIRWFIAALLAGTVVGTYSTLYVAPPLLIYLTPHDKR